MPGTDTSCIVLAPSSSTYTFFTIEFNTGAGIQQLSHRNITQSKIAFEKVGLPYHVLSHLPTIEPRTTFAESRDPLPACGRNVMQTPDNCDKLQWPSTRGFRQHGLLGFSRTMPYLSIVRCVPHNLAQNDGNIDDCWLHGIQRKISSITLPPDVHAPGSSPIDPFNTRNTDSKEYLCLFVYVRLDWV